MGKTKKCVSVTLLFMLIMALFAQPAYADEDRTITYYANGGYFGSDVSATSNSVTYRKSSGASGTTYYSYTQNLSSSGAKQSSYGNNWNNSHIRGSGRTSSVNSAHVITIPGASKLRVRITWGGESASYDWVCMWAGNYPSYTAANNSGTSVTGKLGGGSYTSTSNTKQYDVNGDTVTFAFRSDGSVVGDGYGYYATIQAIDSMSEVSGHYIAPTSASGKVLKYWNTSPTGNGTSYSSGADAINQTSSGNISLYAQWVDAQYSGTSGECSWGISAKGDLTVWPTNGRSGKLASVSSSTGFPWISGYRYNITTATFEDGVQGNTYCYGLLYNCPKLMSADLSKIDLTTSNYVYYTFGTSDNVNSNSTCPNLCYLKLGAKCKFSGSLYIPSFTQWTKMSTGQKYWPNELYSQYNSSPTNMAGEYYLPQVFAIYYSDNSLVFQDSMDANPAHGDILAKYWAGGYVSGIYYTGHWHQDSNAGSVTSVSFETSFAPQYTSNWFDYTFQNVRTISGLDNLDVSNTSDFSNMLSGIKVSSLDISSWDTRNANNMYNMLPASLTELVIGDLFRVTYENAETNLHYAWKNVDTGDQYENLESAIYEARDTGLPGHYRRIAVPVILYENGDLVFQDTEEPNEEYGEVVREYSLICDNVNAAAVPWVDEMEDIQKVRFDAPIKPTTTAEWFSGAVNLTDVIGTDKVDTSKLCYMNNMFSGCSSLESINIRDWDVRNVRYISGLFAGSGIETIDLHGWTFEDMQGDISDLFVECPNLTYVNMNNWTINNEDEYYDFSVHDMIYDCPELERIDIDNFKVNWLGYDRVSTVGFDSLFGNCENLKTLNANNWDIDLVSPGIDVGYIVYACPDMTSINIQNWSLKSYQNNITINNALNDLSVKAVNMDGWIVNAGNKNSNAQIALSRMCNNCNVDNSVNMSGWNCNANHIYSNNNESLLNYCSGENEININNWTLTGYGELNSCIVLGCYDSKKVSVKDWTVNSSFYFNQPIVAGLDYAEEIDLSNWTFNSRIERISPLVVETWMTTSLNIDNWDFTKVNEFQTYGGPIYIPALDCPNLERITVGPKFTSEFYDIELPEPNPDSTTGRWMMESDNTIAYSPPELRECWDGAIHAGTWILEKMDDRCVVMYDPNGGWLDCQYMDVVKDAVRLPTQAFRDDYKLVGWCVDKDGNDTVYAPGTTTAAPVQHGEKITLYAQWEEGNDTRAQYTVRYWFESEDDPSQTYIGETWSEYANAGDTVEAPVRYFNGFISPEPQMVTVEEDGSSVVDYMYSRTHYTVVIDKNGADYGSMSPTTFAMAGGSSMTIPDCQYYKKGTTFSHWNTEPDNSGKSYYPNRYVSNLGQNGDTVTLYAIWKDNGMMSDVEDGEFIVSAKANQTVVIPDLKGGTNYEIEEIDLPKGWNLDHYENQTGFINPGETASAGAYNNYTANGTASIILHKKVNGRDIEPGEYSFNLYDSYHDNSQTATNLAVDKAQTLYGPHTEAVPFKTKLVHSSNIDDNGDLVEGLNLYNNGEYHSRTYVISGADQIRVRATYGLPNRNVGNCYLEVNDYNGNYYHSFQSFNDSLSDPVVEEFVVPGDSVYVNIDLYSNNNASYYGYKLELIGEKLEERTGEYPNPWYNTAPIVFSDIDIPNPGEYWFYVSEDSGSDENMEYDAHQEWIKVIAEDNGDGTLNLTTTCGPTNGLFTNTYHEPDEDPGTGPVSLDGGMILFASVDSEVESVKNADYTFTITATNPDGTPYENIFSAGYYDYDGWHWLDNQIRNGDTVTLKLNAPVAWIEGDMGYLPAAYDRNLPGGVVEAWNLPVGGTCEITPTLPSGVSIKQTEKNFTTLNGYSPDPNDYTVYQKYGYAANGSQAFSATLRYLNAETNEPIPIPADTFQFALTTQSGKTIQTAYANEDGSISFDEISVNENDAGKQVLYFIHEIANRDSTITIDDHAEEVRLAVTDNGDGTLAVSPVYDDDGAVFTNLRSQPHKALTVTNVIAGEGGNQNHLFHYNLNLPNSDIAELAYEKDGETGTLTAENGSFEFDLAAGSITFPSIDTGTAFILSQDQEPKYQVTVDGEEKDVVSQTMDEDRTVVFTNTKTSVPVSLTVSNTITGSAGNLNQEFRYTLSVATGTDLSSLEYTLGDESGTLNATESGFEFELKDQSITFSNIDSDTEITVTQTPVNHYHTTVDDVESTETTFTLSEDKTVSFVNRFDATVPTSAFSSGALGMLVICVAGLAVWVVIARKRVKQH